jgi:hypothetical protein
MHAAIDGFQRKCWKSGRANSAAPASWAVCCLGVLLPAQSHPRFRFGLLWGDQVQGLVLYRGNTQACQHKHRDSQFESFGQHYGPWIRHQVKFSLRFQITISHPHFCHTLQARPSIIGMTTDPHAMLQIFHSRQELNELPESRALTKEFELFKLWII